MADRLIDCEEGRFRAALIGMLREMDRKS